MAEFEMKKSFNIDNGELDGFTPQNCFVLGYELAQIDALLETGKEFRKPVHAANQDRILKSCTDAGRLHSLNWMQGDPSEAWMELQVEAAESSPQS